MFTIITISLLVVLVVSFAMLIHIHKLCKHRHQVEKDAMNQLIPIWLSSKQKNA